MKKLIIFTSPIILFIELILLNSITQLLRAPSDIAVFVGLIILCFAIAGNFYLYQFIKNQFKQKQK